MKMFWFLSFWKAAWILLLSGGCLALCFGRRPKTAARAGSAFCCAGLLAALAATVCGFVFSGTDSLALWFQLPVELVGLAAALHTTGYLAGHGEERSGMYWFFFNGMLLSMLAVTQASELLRFLFAWELMGLTSFVLVAFDKDKRSVVRASWIYLLSCEAGGLLLILLAATAEPALQLVYGLLAFGLKAGFPILHVWLPEAHPAAPAPVSAVMSGAMIPLGFLGILRFLPIGSFEIPVGVLFLALGIIGSFTGILFALPQSNLKKLLAYSSVENMGIVLIGLGLGFLFADTLPAASVCAFTGAMLHILNHALLKGTLFLGAGTLYKAVHTLDMDTMGGLHKSQPSTFMLFVLSSLGICGLPPFCGFTGELLIYCASVFGVLSGNLPLTIAGIAAALGLAATGGMACAVLSKAVSSVFSGAPRSAAAENAAHEESRMVLPLWLLTVPALILPLAAPFLFGDRNSPFLQTVLCSNAFFSFSVPLLLGILLLWKRQCLPRGTDSEVKSVWDCGYARPTARMEYTATAFSQPLADLFNALLRQTKTIHRAQGFFPEKAEIRTGTEDYSDRLLWKGLSRFTGYAAERIHRFQSGYLHLYILVMVLALGAMLAWGFFLCPSSAHNADRKEAIHADR